MLRRLPTHLLRWMQTSLPLPHGSLREPPEPAFRYPYSSLRAQQPRYFHHTWGGTTQPQFDPDIQKLTIFRPDRWHYSRVDPPTEKRSAGKAALITCHSRWPLGKEGNCARPENRISTQRFIKPSVSGFPRQPTDSIPLLVHIATSRSAGMIFHLDPYLWSWMLGLPRRSFKGM